jgi:predicted permease
VAHFTTVVDDLRLAMRTLRTHPLFAAVVLTTLGLGIGVNSAIFSVINAALFSSLNVRAPGELVNVYTTDSTGHGFGSTSYPDFAYVRDNNRAFSGVIGYSGLMTTITGNGKPEVLFGEIVSGNYFTVTGARLLLGRGFVSEEDRTPGTHPVVVLGHGLWQRRFAGDSSIVGKHVTLNGHSFTVVGVAAPEFKGLLFRGLAADLWAPVMMMKQLRTDQLANRDERWMFVKGRLAPGSSLEGARAALVALGAQLASAYPATNVGRTFAALPSTDVRIHPEGDRAALSGAALVILTVGFVLLVACTNLANLMLARASARQREIAVRLAVGASRGALVRQLLMESAVLAFFGGVAGLTFAFWFARLLITFRPPLPVPISLDVGIDLRVMLFTALISIFAVVLFGLVPALQASRTRLTGVLTTQAGALGFAPRTRRLGNLFLVPQLALSLVLLVVAGLFVRSIGKADAVDPGFDMSHTALVALDVHLDGYDELRARGFYEGLERRITAAPGVRAVTITDRIPLDLYGNQSTTAEVPSSSTSGDGARAVQYARIDRGYFDALGVALLRGRAFTESEIAAPRGSAPVVIVNEAAARRYWPNANPIGQRLRIGSTGESREVVGVAANTKVQTLGEAPEALLYLPFDGRYARLLRIIARTSGDSRALVNTMRSAVAAQDPGVAIFEGKTLGQHLDVMLFPYRLAAGVSTAIGLFALLLASIGLYGVVAFGVTRRTREFGIRMALGAHAAQVLRLVLRESFRVVAIGIAIGLTLALGIARVLSGVLFGISAADPVTLISVPALLTAVALLASWVPAWRATRVHPAVALRE